MGEAVRHPGTDAARGVTLSEGHLVVVGQTNGDLDASSTAPHGFDGFIATFEVSPERW